MEMSRAILLPTHTPSFHHLFRHRRIRRGKEEEKKRKMKISESSSCQNSENDQSEELTRFDKSLQELKDLSSQLHSAADYCKTTFLNANEKKIVVENTKEYICRAVVAVVDHFGCVSSNLNRNINSKTNMFSGAEVRIDCLKQKLLSCEQYSQKVALTRVRWRANLPNYHRRYLSTQITCVVQPNEAMRRDSDKPAPSSRTSDYKHGFEAEDLPLFLYTSTKKPSSTSDKTSIENSGTNSPLALPVHDELSILSKRPNPTFHFQQTSQKNRRSTALIRRSKHGNDIFSLIRRARRTA